MKIKMATFQCDAPGCTEKKLVNDSAQFEPDAWLFVNAWVVNAGGSPDDPQHFCPTHKTAILKALYRAHD